MQDSNFGPAYRAFAKLGELPFVLQVVVLFGIGAMIWAGDVLVQQSKRKA